MTKSEEQMCPSHGREFSWTERLFVCVALCLLTVMVVGTVNSIAHSDYYFSHPSKRDRRLPAVSEFFFEYYPFAWTIVLMASLWSLRILALTKVRLAELAIFATYTLFFAVSYVMFAALALYVCNQTFVFRFQHLE